MTSRLQQIHIQTRELRLRGQYQLAAQTLNQVIVANLSDPETLVEASKLLVLVHDTIQLRKFYDMMKIHPQASEYWEPELLLRIAQLLGIEVYDDLSKVQKPSRALWVQTFLQSEEDKIVDVIVEDFNLTCNGACIYLFDCRCGDCGHSVPVPVVVGLFFEKALICPLCFVRQRFSTDHVKEFISRKHPIMLSRDLDYYDFYLNRMQQTLGEFHDEKIPLMCRALNQKFIFYFNELVFKRLASKR